MFFSVASLILSASTIGLAQQPKGTEPSQPTKAPATAPPDKTKAKPAEKWRVKVNNQTGIPFISIKAKGAPLADVMAELERQIKVPILLGKLMKKQSLTEVDFTDLSLEMALKTIAQDVRGPLPTVDYKITGGGGVTQARKEPIAIYMTVYNEAPPTVGPYSANESAGLIVSGFVAETPEEEKAYLEKKAQELQVSVKDGSFRVLAKKQPLTDVVGEIAAKVRIPFAILTQDTSQAEFDQVVDWDIKDSTLEDLALTWFPNAIRLYLRTDLETNSTRPLRITLERPSEVRAQAE
ncbi:MAG TPA: hypothetical protein VJU86_03920 [Pyrinomonadaceae bacterium]|nr:hypothetical protein [Pyrinomonadaceae bacterium]